VCEMAGGGDQCVALFVCLSLFCYVDMLLLNYLGLSFPGHGWVVVERVRTEGQTGTRAVSVDWVVRNRRVARVHHAKSAS